MDSRILENRHEKVALEKIIASDIDRLSSDALAQARFYATTYGFGAVLPMVAAGVVGGFVGGPEVARDYIMQASISIAPTNLLFSLGFRALLNPGTDPATNAEYHFVLAHAKLTDYLRSSRIGSSLSLCLAGGLTGFGASLIPEFFFGVDLDQGGMATSGGIMGLGTKIYLNLSGKRWMDRIQNELKKNKWIETETTEHHDVKMEVKDIENMVRFMFGNQDHDIVKSAGHIKDNVYSLKIDTPETGNVQAYDCFGAPDDRNNLVQKLVRTTNKHKHRTDLKIKPSFNSVHLDALLQFPYECLSLLTVDGMMGDEQYFQVSYIPCGEYDSVIVRINSRDHLSLLLDIFEASHERPLRNTEVANLDSLDNDELTISKTIITNVQAELHDLGLDLSEFDLKDPLDVMKPVVPKKDERVVRIAEKAEKPVSCQLSEKVVAMYTEAINSDPKQAVTFAFPGLVYRFDPFYYGDAYASTVKMVCGLRNHVRLFKGQPYVPDLASASLMVQYDGITPNSICSIIRGLEGKHDVRVRPFLGEISFDDAFALGGEKLLEQANQVELTIDKHTKVTISFRPNRNYATLREDMKVSTYIAVHGQLERISRTSVMYQDTQDCPTHVVFRGDTKEFASNSYLSISIGDVAGDHRGVFVDEGVRKLNELYMSIVNIVEGLGPSTSLTVK